jgi:hypothetical protein
MQTGRVLDKGEREVTPYVSTIGLSSGGETEKLQTGYGVIAGMGVAENRRVDVRFRYERIEFDGGGEGVNVLSAGPKFRMGSDDAALYLPIGFGFGGDLDMSQSWETHPTFLATETLASWAETTASVKALIRFADDPDLRLAFNFGAGLGPDPRRVAVRPEVGIMINPGNDGFTYHLSVGLIVGFGEPRLTPPEEDLVGGFAFNGIAFRDMDGALEVSGEIVNRSGIDYEKATFTVMCSDLVGGVLGTTRFELSGLQQNGGRNFTTYVTGVEAGSVAHCRVRFEEGLESTDNR